MGDFSFPKYENFTSFERSKSPLSLFTDEILQILKNGLISVSDSSTNDASKKTIWIVAVVYNDLPDKQFRSVTLF